MTVKTLSQREAVVSAEPQFRFRFDRALQAAAYLLNLAPDRELRHVHLLKMLYIADREYLAKFGEMITGDRVCAMQYGPVLTSILDLIKGKGKRADDWARHIQTLPKSHKVRLLHDPQNGSLCRASRELLDDVFRRFGNLKPFEVVRLTHEFPEWEIYYHDDTSTPIPWTEILRCQGKEAMIPASLEAIRVDGFMTGMWGTE